MCRAVDVPPGFHHVVDIELTPLTPGNDLTISGSLTSVLGNAFAETTVDIVDPSITADLHPTVTAPDGGFVGQPFSIGGHIVNAGSTDFDDVTATFEVGSELQVDAATWGTDNPCNVAAATVTCAIGAVAAYSNVPISVDVTPVAVGDSLTTVTVESTQPEDDPDPFPNTQELTVPVVDAAVDLGITVGHFPPVVIGEQENVTAMVTNAGPAVARTTELSVVVPDNFTINGASIPLGQAPPNATGCVVSDQTVTCGLGDLAPGRNTLVNVGLLPADFGDDPLVWSVTSAIPEVDPDPTPNTATQHLPVQPPSADIEIDEFFGPAQTVVGEPFVATLLFENNGPSTVIDAQARVEVPAGWDVQSATINVSDLHGRCEVAGQTATCTLDEFGGSEDREVTVTAVPSETTTGAGSGGVDHVAAARSRRACGSAADRRRH